MQSEGSHSHLLITNLTLPVVFKTIEVRMVPIFLAHSPILSQHMSYRYRFLSTDFAIILQLSVYD